MDKLKNFKKFENNNDDDDNYSQNLKNYYNTDISLMEFAEFMSHVNSDSEIECVFHYLEKFLKKEKGIKVDIEKALDEESEL